MGLVTTSVLQLASRQKPLVASRTIVGGGGNSSTNSMSQGFHQGIFSFSDGFDRPTPPTNQEQHHIAQQSRRDKLRVQGFEPPPGPHSLVPIDEEASEEPGGIYETATGGSNMLSEMFNFPSTATPDIAPELLANQIPGSFRLPSRMVGFGTSAGDWYNNHRGPPHGMVLGGGSSSSSNLGPIGDAKPLNVESAAAMQLFLMNPTAVQPQAHPRSPSPSHPSTLHHHHHHQAFQSGQFGHEGTSFSGGVVEGQGLSLSLSSSLQQFDMAKADPQELRLRDGVLYFNSSSNQQQQQQQQQQNASILQLQGGQQSQHHATAHMGYGPMNAMRNSKYARAAQELLEEFCSVGRSQLKGRSSSKFGSRHRASSSSNPNPNPNPNQAGAAAASSSSSKDIPPLSPADRFEHQRKKSKLLSMLDEVDRRYNHYCDQMQMVVNSFDSVMGFGAATPYTALAQKAMSRHFRCLKDAIVAQLKHTCELLGEKEAGGGSGITKGETPRLRLLDQSLRQQRAFHQMGMMEQEAWRPQRGLPERSVTILRAWLFEHFLHPYPSDADKHLLARQTGLSRNQVSNWFINARVRLWKPMVEEMYQQESKDDTEDTQRDDASHQTSHSPITNQNQHQHLHQHQHQHSQQQGQRPQTDAPESDPSSSVPAVRHHRFPVGSSMAHQSASTSDGPAASLPAIIDTPDLCGPHDELYREYGTTGQLGPAAQMRRGTSGDVSLTLGLRHTGNAPEKSRPFSIIRDFGDC